MEIQSGRLISTQRELSLILRSQEWILDEKHGIEHIKYAYENGINTFEQVISPSPSYSIALTRSVLPMFTRQERVKLSWAKL